MTSTITVLDANQDPQIVSTVDAITALIGTLTDASQTDPAAASASWLALARGQLEEIKAGIISAGVAGSPSSQVISVQGVASMKPMITTSVSQYEDVTAGGTAQVLGTTGAVGDYLEVVTCVVSTASTSQVTVLDGSSSFIILPASVAGGIGTYTIPCGWTSVNGPWKITTAAGVSVRASGVFT